MANRNTVVPDQYQGREQSFIKHELLKGYLERLFHIVGMGSSRLGIKELCYVDCFAGPWSSESTELQDTSIAISLSELSRALNRLHSLDVHLRARALYVEKDARAYSRLEEFLEKRQSDDIEAKSLHGDFVSLRNEILQWPGSEAFCFFFIDPTGWKEVAVPVLQPLLNRSRSEYLINFMYDFVNRTASMADWKPEITELVGEALNVNNMSSDVREKYILSVYRRNLISRVKCSNSQLARSAYVRVLDRKKERPKYHLVYLTTHPRGIIEFMNISEKIDLVQKQVRASMKQAEKDRQSGMDDMFGSAYVDEQAGHVTQTEVQNFWLDYLSEGPRKVDQSSFADILEKTDWFPGDLQMGLKTLIDMKRVKNLDAPKSRPKKPLHYEKKGGETLALVE